MFKTIREAFAAIRSGPQSEAPDLAREIERQACSTDLASMSDRELQAIEDSCSAVMAAARSTRLRRRGWKMAEWLHPGPGSIREECEVGEPYWIIPNSEWGQRSYCAVQPDGARLYIGEPDEIGPRGIRELAALADEGWNITITGRYSTHFPGRTLHVRVFRGADRL